jgi:membrane protein DedA with SNARE-associated domain
VDLEAIVEGLRQWPPALVYLVLFLTAFVEYVVPPVPGDTFVVGGAVLVSAFGWSFLPVLLVVTAGAAFGAWVDFRVGRWLQRSGRLDKLPQTAREGIDGVVAQMKKHGPMYLAINRFVPGLRAFFFVAAGLAGLTTGQVLLWSTVSALAWNAGLVGLGYALGKNLGTLEAVLRDYSVAMWILIGLVFSAFVWRIVAKRRKAK